MNERKTVLLVGDDTVDPHDAMPTERVKPSNSDVTAYRVTPDHKIAVRDAIASTGAEVVAFADRRVLDTVARVRFSSRAKDGVVVDHYDLPMDRVRAGH